MSSSCRSPARHAPAAAAAAIWRIHLGGVQFRTAAAQVFPSRLLVLARRRLRTVATAAAAGLADSPRSTLRTSLRLEDDALSAPDGRTKHLAGWKQTAVAQESASLVTFSNLLL